MSVSLRKVCFKLRRALRQRVLGVARLVDPGPWETWFDDSSGPSMLQALQERFNVECDVDSAVAAADFLEAHPRQGRNFTVPGWHFNFYELRSCLCYGNNGQIIMPILPDGKIRHFLAEYSNYPGLLPDKRAFIGGSTSEFKKIDRAVAACPFWGDNFWHFTFEVLPKIMALEESGYDGAYIVPTGKSYIEEYLALFDVKPERILPNTTAWHADTLIVPQPFPGHAFLHEQSTLARVRSSLLEKTGTLPGTKRCYIKRITSRKIANEEEIVPILERYDFESIVPENFPVREKLLFLTNSELTFTPHGANTALTLLQKKHSALLEAFSCHYVNYSVFPTGKLLSMDYFPLPEATKDVHLRWNPQFDYLGADIHVNPFLFEKVLRRNIHSRDGA